MLYVICFNICGAVDTIVYFFASSFYSSSIPCFQCSNYFAFKEITSYFQKNPEFKKKWMLKIRIALLGAYLFTQCYMGVYLNKVSSKCYRRYQRTFFVFVPSKVELRDKEIERLVLALDGGRSHEIISLESRSKSNEKLIAHLNLQVIDLLLLCSQNYNTSNLKKLTKLLAL